jgi:sugar phosphate isomerase/epimerase
MKLAFSSNAFREYSLEDTIGILAGIGYEGLELMADRPHAWPEDMTPAKLDSIRRALEKHRMQVSNVNAFMMCAYKDPKSGRSGTFHWPSWIDKDVDTREARIRHTVACVDVAAAVGAKTMSTEPGGPLEGRTRTSATGSSPRGSSARRTAGWRRASPSASSRSPRSSSRRGASTRSSSVST